MPLAYFFRPSRDETESLAVASGAIIFLLRLGQYLLVVFEQVATKALAIGPNPETILLCIITDPSDIDAIHNALPCVIELPPHHFLGSRGRTNCLDQLKYLLWALNFQKHLSII